MQAKMVSCRPEIAQQVKAPATKPEDLSSVPGTLDRRREPIPASRPLTTHASCHMCVHTHINVKTVSYDAV